MDFFRHQEIARRNGRLLLILFLGAVLLLVLLTNVAISGWLWFSEHYNVYSGARGGLSAFIDQFSWGRFGRIGLAVGATVALVAGLRWLQLSRGGKAVAESLGARRVLPQTRDRHEQRCLNVVEEMALAANMPVPALYVLEGERGINAFAAGITPADAVVTVTRGTLLHLRRHELQGVIAHEFSHILNGDMRLNTRLAALLKGITFIQDVGHFVLRASNRSRGGLSSGRRGEGSPALPLLGLCLYLLGALGALAAGFIKAAISRQREYLADACAVQYTRDPSGIRDALKVIGGYLPGTLVHAARAAELSHIFFGQVTHPLWQVFATHPPLPLRIRRLEPAWDGRYIERKLQTYPAQPERPGAGEAGVGRAALVAAATGLHEPDASGARAGANVEAAAVEAAPVATAAVATGTAVRHDLPLAFVRHSHEPLGAQALLFSLLMTAPASGREAQLAAIARAGTAGLETLVVTLLPGVAGLAPRQRLPLLEICLPALKSMSPGQYRVFRETLAAVVQADGRTELFEWCLFQLLRHYLDPEFQRVSPSRPRYRRLEQVREPLEVVLSTLAQQGGGAGSASIAAAAAALGLPALASLPPERCSVVAFGRAVQELADCYPLLKPRVLKAMALIAGADGEVCGAEREIIHSVAAVMDCPVPTASATPPISP
jgi:Zn-dependent protease with chaperone function